MARIEEKAKSIVLENRFAEIYLSKSNSLVEKIIDKKTGKDMKSEETHFFEVFTKDLNAIPITALSLKDDIITASTEKGDLEIKVGVFDTYFTFEVAKSLPEGIYKLHMIRAKYDYDYADKENTAVATVSMSIWADPVYFPDSKSRESICRVFPHLGDKGAKIGLVIAPRKEHREILKAVCLTIDKSVGFASRVGGAFACEHRPNLDNYSIQYDCSKEFIKNNIEYYKKVGIDQLDMYFGGGSTRQGDFKQKKYESHAEYKKYVTDVLEENGIRAGLHTFTCYINTDCETFIANKKYRDQFMVLESLTLAEDMTKDSLTLKLEEGEFERGMDIEAQHKSYVVFIDDEALTFTKGQDGGYVVTRGHAGTKAAPHKKGAEVRHIRGCYFNLVPQMGSELFYEVARCHAKVYNECGFMMFYLDASDGIHQQSSNKEDESWFYMTSFAHEIYKNCNTDPILESCFSAAAMWPVLSRKGALDTFIRGYKSAFDKHVEGNIGSMDRYLTPTLGWSDFYPASDDIPGNVDIKYYHTDVVDFVGTKAIIYDNSNVINGTKDKYYKCAGLRRNVELYKKYDVLRKSCYFSEEYREKLKASRWELQLREKGNGKFTFVEKDYQGKILYDLSSDDECSALFNNPFTRHTPFLRIEALLSTQKKNPIIMMRFNESVDITEQKLKIRYAEGGLNFSDNLAKVVRIKGNGVEGGKVGIKVRSGRDIEKYFGYYLYVIDTDYEGWREFTLIESENGERHDHHFEDEHWIYAVHRCGVSNGAITGIDVVTEGDVTGVRMSDILAYEHTYEVLKNPTVTVKDTSVTFECELQSSDFIEFDGKTARVIDRYGNEKEIYFKNDGFITPKGKFEATLSARALNGGVPRAKLTFGFTGKEIK